MVGRGDGDQHRLRRCVSDDAAGKSHRLCADARRYCAHRHRYSEVRALQRGDERIDELVSEVRALRTEIAEQRKELLDRAQAVPKA